MQVSDHLEAFERAWNAAEQPALEAFLPAETPELRRLVLAELIKYDLDRRLQSGVPRTIEEYLAAFPDLDRGTGPPCDLIYEDFHLRRQAGLAPQPGDYFQRFPRRADELARLLGNDIPAQSTALHASRLPVKFQAGEQLDDFGLLVQLGEGQFAKVFLARQRSMQRLVALKISRQRGAEAETLAQLDHPHIVRVYDQRYLPDRELLLVYMPYLPGGTLHEVVSRVNAVVERSGRTLLEAVDAALERRGELPLASAARQQLARQSWSATVCSLGVKLAAALEYAHGQGVLHRDVKPANVLLTAEGEPLLADFNIGCCTKLEGAGPAAFFGGSLAYMSAEHLEAFDPAHARLPESLDGRADLFGLAVTLWETLCGQRPFGSEPLRGDWPETLAMLIRQRREGPSQKAIDALPDDLPGFQEILLKCLDPDIECRPRSAGELRHELELCLRPATRELLKPQRRDWRQFVQRHPVATLLPVGLTPNALGSIFNIEYNRAEILDNWPAAVLIFGPITLAFNALFFPVGVLLFALSIRPAARCLQRLRLRERCTAEDLAYGRKCCLRLGRTTAAICVGAWIVAGLIWPVALRIAAGPPPQGPEAYVHFVMSLVICGLIAGAYPYFLVTYISLRAFYPALLEPSGLSRQDLPALHRVERELGRYRAAAMAVPLLAVALLAGRGITNHLAVTLLSVAGLAGTVLAYTIEGWTRSTLTALTADN